jgi:methylthioribose-1-phosphate isomerase
MINTLEWTDAGVRFIDQTKLPTEETYVTCRTYQEVADAIRTMIVRGAPAIGVAAAMGIALGARDLQAETAAEFRPRFDRICDVLAATRPTAVNLFWAVRRMREKLDTLKALPVPQIKQALIAEARQMHAEDIAANEAMGRHGAALMPAAGGVLTHCNAGALATCGYGTALGVIRAAVAAGKRIHVFADETRPFLRRHDAAGKNQSRSGGRRPHCRERRCGQQNRYLFGRDSGEGAWHSVLCGRALLHSGSGYP